MSSSQAPPLPGALNARLSLMMFLQYAIWGAWLPILYPFLTGHRAFTLEQCGLCLSAGAVGAIVGPFLAGQVADRKFATPVKRWREYLKMTKCQAGGKSSATVILKDVVNFGNVRGVNAIRLHSRSTDSSRFFNSPMTQRPPFECAMTSTCPFDAAFEFEMYESHESTV